MAKHKKTKKLSRAQQRRKQDILDASLLIFDRDGFDAAKMSDIAKAADVAKGTLYLYFDNKSALLEGMIESAIIPTLQAAVETSQNHDCSSAELLQKQMKIMATRMASHEMRILLRFMMSSNTDQHRTMVSFYFENVIQKGIALLRQTIQKGVESGEFRKELSEIDPLVLLGSQIYTTIWKIVFEDLSPIDIEQLNKDLIDVLLNGLLKK